MALIPQALLGGGANFGTAATPVVIYQNNCDE